MSILETHVEPLTAGENLSREEFLSRWEALPELKRAELIGGIVYMPSPMKIEHGDTDFDVSQWIGPYVQRTPGCKAGHNATWLMLGDAPQPDLYLRILPEFGGQSRIDKRGYAGGAPELVVEVCLSSTAYDLHQKKDLYEEAGVREYVAVLLREKEVRWHRLVGKTYEVLSAPADGVYRSAVFPGLWLNAKALLAGDMKQVLSTLDRGLESPEHAEFKAALAQRRS